MLWWKLFKPFTQATVVSHSRKGLFSEIFLGILPDKRLQDERRRAFLKLQLFVMQRFGVGTTFGSSLSKQHNAIIISEGKRALEKETHFIVIVLYQIKL